MVIRDLPVIALVITAADTEQALDLGDDAVSLELKGSGSWRFSFAPGVVETASVATASAAAWHLGAGESWRRDDLMDGVQRTLYYAASAVSVGVQVLKGTQWEG
jgi:hypothetical protein